MVNMKKEIHAFLFACRCVFEFEKLKVLTNSFREYENLPQKEFDDSEYKTSLELYNTFLSTGDEMYETNLNATYIKLYTLLVENLSSPDTAKELLGIELSLDDDDINGLSQKIYDEVFAYFEKEGSALRTPDEDVSIFLEILQNIFKGSEESHEHFVCPYCGGEPDVVEAADFFGDDSKYDGEKICCCECGAYAKLNSDDTIIGTMATKSLHAKRNMVRSLALEFSKATGSTKYETSIKLIKKLNKYFKDYRNAIDYFSDEDCNTLIDVLNKANAQLPTQTASIAYPKSHAELMQFFKAGMRIRIVKDITGRHNNRFLCPLQVGDSCVVAASKSGGTETFQFPNIKHMYVFNQNKFEIHHPSNSVDEYIMYPAELRNIPL